MSEINESFFVKTIMSMIFFERDTYLLYAEAVSKVSHPECKKILQEVSEQTRDHMGKVIDIYNKFLVHRGVLDDETANLLLDTKKSLTNVEDNCANILRK